MVIFQGYAQRFCNRIQLKTVQIRKQDTRQGNRIHNRRLAWNIQPLTVFLDKTHIEIGIMGNHNTSLAEFHKFRKNVCNDRCINHHGIIDRRQLLNPKRNRHLWIDKR